MTTRIIKTVTLLACAVLSTLALAADPPARVGRVSLSQGQVSISNEIGEQPSAALVNWPVTSQNQLTTGLGARTEIRIGSTSVRLDGESSLEVTELDDDSLRLRLNYGSAYVRVLNADVLRGFELETPNGLVRLQEPGRLRVDAERVRGTTVVNVFDGVAVVNDRGSQLIVRAGKRAEISDDDVRTGVAMRDGFDDWAMQRDRRDDNSASARYVTIEMTGYEDLDQYGAWRDDGEYGPLWLPRMVGPDWAPYRDGSWTWVEPWGWTWVDNAPWGYAPFHYGRWVYVNQRWAWAPGRHIGPPVWAPALVGWVGGGGWSASFGSGRAYRPAQGWYPLAPHDAFVPGYRLSHDHLQRINRDARPDGRDDRRGRDWRGERHHDGLTVVPRDQFGQRGTVAVRNSPRAFVPPMALPNAPGAAPAAPQGAGRGHDGRGDRFDRDANQRWRNQRPEAAPRPPMAMPAPQMSTGPLGIAVARAQAQAQAQAQAHGPVAAPPPSPRRDGRTGFEERGQRPQPAPVPTAPPVAAPIPAPAAVHAPFDRRDERDAGDRRRDGRVFEDLRQRPQPTPQAAPTPVAPPHVAAPAAMPAPQAAMPPPEQGQRGRGFRNEGERRMRESEGAPQPRQMVPAPVIHQQPAPVAMPAPVRQAPPPPPPAAQPPAPPPAASAPPPGPRNNPAMDRKRGNEPER
ncbi:MAG: hypothetical protein JWP34_417 [Massilia sp.]|nr:hypothetical protein [Massilia sp.]